MTNPIQNRRLNALAEKMKKGDKGAAEEIFNNFSPQIFRFLLSRLANREIAEDLTQDIFFKVVRKIETFDKKSGNFSTWLWQIARNSLIDYYREKKTVPLSDFLEETKNIPDENNNLKARIEAREILSAIKNFSPEDQEIFTLRYVSDLSYRDISKLVGKTEGSLRVIIHRINNKLREIING